MSRPQYRKHHPAVPGWPADTTLGGTLAVEVNDVRTCVNRNALPAAYVQSVIRKAMRQADAPASHSILWAALSHAPGVAAQALLMHAYTEAAIIKGARLSRLPEAEKEMAAESSLPRYAVTSKEAGQ